MKQCNEYVYDDIEIGHKESFDVTITEKMEDEFRGITGDMNPLHLDDHYAQKTGRFQSHVTFGMLTASLYSTLAGVYLPGKYSLIHSVEVGFVKPVYAGDCLTVSGECVDKQDGLKLISLKVAIRNQSGAVVAKGKMKVMVLK